MPSITQLEYIIAVADHRHFAKAAKVRNISQPTLSQQINKAEDELGIRIFDRDKKPVLLTQHGKTIVEQARTILREHKKLFEFSRQHSGDLAGSFRLGIIPTVSSMLVPAFVEEFAKSCPKVKLFIDELPTESLIKNLQTDQLDAAILATPLNIDGLQEEPLYYETFKIYASAGHALLKKKACTRKDLDGRDIWLLRDGHCFKNQIVKYCSITVDEALQDRNVHFQSGNLETLQRLIARGHGFTLIPAFMTSTMSKDDLKDHVTHFTSPEPAREISLVTHRNHWKSKFVDALRSSILANLPATVHKSKNKGLEVLDVC
ncbi:MAG: LysR substrate-binding domain-containing protein [Bdellovibrio sp.]|jgi:LysR family hydrogen peroxide-inducible transcriptional activator